MKKFLVTLLVSVYAMLVPACFFSGEHPAETLPSAVAASHGDKQMNMGCVIGNAQCAAGPEASSGTPHHTNMYYSFLGFMQTKGLFSVISLLALLPLLLFTLTESPLFRLPARIFSYIKKRKEIFSIHKNAFLRWLSLSINSPAHHLTM